MHDCEIDLKNITKIEGHANLYVKVKERVVRDVRFEISENKRFFEKIVKGRNIRDVPLMVSRICGFCSASHLLTATKAIENAYGLELSEQNLALRKIFVNGEFIKSHALHLYFLALPDYLNKGSILEFGENEHEFIHIALRLKEIGSKMLELIGGRSHHSINIYPGGIKYLPSKDELEKLRKSCEEAKKDAYETINLFSEFGNAFGRPTDYVALVNDDYNFIDGSIASTSGICVPESSYLKYVEEFIVPYSLAKQAKFAGKEFMVGALARMNINKEKMSNETKKIVNEFKLKFPSHSAFMNNAAQAVEIYHCLDTSIKLIDEIKLRHEDIPKLKRLKSENGIGVTEAPRGTLYHEYKIGKNGIVKDGNIIVPTSQNARTIEKDIEQYLPSLLDLPQEKIELEIEKLIRAYDPCISCATHFLKVKWEKE